MNVTAVTKDKVTHVFVNNQWQPPITVPAHIHEKTLRNINQTRTERER